MINEDYSSVVNAQMHKERQGYVISHMVSLIRYVG